MHIPSFYVSFAIELLGFVYQISAAVSCEAEHFHNSFEVQKVLHPYPLFK